MLPGLLSILINVVHQNLWAAAFSGLAQWLRRGDFTEGHTDTVISRSHESFTKLCKTQQARAESCLTVILDSEVVNRVSWASHLGILEFYTLWELEGSLSCPHLMCEENGAQAEWKMNTVCNFVWWACFHGRAVELWSLSSGEFWLWYCGGRNSQATAESKWNSKIINTSKKASRFWELKK